jgi:hypothetical protein
VHLLFCVEVTRVCINDLLSRATAHYVRQICRLSAFTAHAHVQMSKPDLDLTAADAFAPLGLGSTLKRISQAVLYLASRPIAITSLPVVDFRVLHRTPNHAKGRILSIYCIANACFAPRASPSCLFLSSTISHLLPSVLFSYHVVK